jgi:hypothetical protein
MCWTKKLLANPNIVHFLLQLWYVSLRRAAMGENRSSNIFGSMLKCEYVIWSLPQYFVLDQTGQHFFYMPYASFVRFPNYVIAVLCKSICRQFKAETCCKDYLYVAMLSFWINRKNDFLDLC